MNPGGNHALRSGHLREREARDSAGWEAELNRQLAALSSRDSRIWAFGIFVFLLVGIGIVVVFLPSIIEQTTLGGSKVGDLPRAIMGLLCTACLFIVYSNAQRREIRTLRQELIRRLVKEVAAGRSDYLDPLTKVFSRKFLESEIIRDFLGQSGRNNCSVVLLDITAFGQINLRFGHAVGDTLLSELASILVRALRGADAVVRYGPDEFLLLLPDTQLLQAQRVIERVQKALEVRNRQNESRPAIHFSYGCAEFSESVELSDVLKIAEQNLKQNKVEVDHARRSKLADYPRCLVVCANAETLAVIRPLMESSHIEVQLCTDREEALQRLRMNRYDGVLVDLDGGPSGIEFINQIRSIPSATLSVLVALVHKSGVERVFKVGTNLVIEKPVNSQLAQKTLEIAQQLMIGEKRRYSRAKISIPIVLHAENFSIAGNANNLSEGGMSVKVPVALDKREYLVKFQLPGLCVPLALEAFVVWADSVGNVGLKFKCISTGATDVLKQWLGEQYEREHAIEMLRPVSASLGGDSAGVVQ